MPAQSINELLDQSLPNPLLLLGVEPWMLRSLDEKSVKRFLLDMKKILGKYHHPDNYLDPYQKNLHQTYYARVTNAIDRLLDDNYELQKNLHELGAKEKDTLKVELEHTKRQYIKILEQLKQKGLDQEIASSKIESLEDVILQNFNLYYQLMEIDHIFNVKSKFRTNDDAFVKKMKFYSWEYLIGLRGDLSLSKILFRHMSCVGSPSHPFTKTELEFHDDLTNLCKAKHIDKTKTNLGANKGKIPSEMVLTNDIEYYKKNPKSTSLVIGSLPLISIALIHKRCPIDRHENPLKNGLLKIHTPEDDIYHSRTDLKSLLAPPIHFNSCDPCQQGDGYHVIPSIINYYPLLVVRPKEKPMRQVELKFELVVPVEFL